MTTRFQVRRDTASNWSTANPILAPGEPGLETDTAKVKYGDGLTAWNSLAYSGAAFPNGMQGIVTSGAPNLTNTNPETNQGIYFQEFSDFDTNGVYGRSVLGWHDSANQGLYNRVYVDPYGVTIKTVNWAGSNNFGSPSAHNWYFDIQSGSLVVPGWISTYDGRNGNTAADLYLSPSDGQSGINIPADSGSATTLSINNASGNGTISLQSSNLKHNGNRLIEGVASGFQATTPTQSCGPLTVTLDGTGQINFSGNNAIFQFQHTGTYISAANGSTITFGFAGNTTVINSGTPVYTLKDNNGNPIHLTTAGDTIIMVCSAIDLGQTFRVA
jgi:hypothetical protein